MEGEHRKVRYIPVAPIGQRLISDYLEAAGHTEGALFRPIKNNVTGTLNKSLHTNALLQCGPALWRSGGDFKTYGFCVHSLRATAATNGLDNQADITRVQGWLGHYNIATTRLYDKRGTRVEGSPTFRIRYEPNQ